MLNSSRKIFQAMEAVIYIGCHQAEEPVSSKSIAETQSLPPRHLEQILQKLVKANILRGVRGPRGGYFLAREKRRISLRDIYEALEETDQADSRNGTGTPNSANDNLLSPAMAAIHQEINEELLQKLSQKTLKELCDNAMQDSSASSAQTNDFMI